MSARIGGIRILSRYFLLISSIAIFLMSALTSCSVDVADKSPTDPTEPSEPVITEPGLRGSTWRGYRYESSTHPDSGVTAYVDFQGSSYEISIVVAPFTELVVEQGTFTIKEDVTPKEIDMVEERTYANKTYLGIYKGTRLSYEEGDHRYGVKYDDHLTILLSEDNRPSSFDAEDWMIRYSLSRSIYW